MGVAPLGTSVTKTDVINQYIGEFFHGSLVAIGACGSDKFEIDDGLINHLMQRPDIVHLSLPKMEPFIIRQLD